MLELLRVVVNGESRIWNWLDIFQIVSMLFENL
jgi:hypothetical protein